MALSERSRSILFTSLSSVIPDPKAVQDMLSHFPARDVEESVTKEHLRAEMAIQRAELQAEFGAFRSEVQADFGALRAEMHTEVGALRQEIGAVRVELRDALRQQTQWLIGVMVTLCSLVLAISAFTR